MRTGKGPRRAAGPAGQQAENLWRTRSEHASEVTQDYVEAIAELEAQAGEARVVDLARRLGVTHVTVHRTIARLSQAGYVTARPYRAISLTPAGARLARQCGRRHRIVVEFLRTLGVPRRVAERDAEGIEHHVSAETLAAFNTALRRASQSSTRVTSGRQRKRAGTANQPMPGLT